MKKIAFLLSLILVFSVFAVACQDTSETSDASDASSNAENTSEEAKKQFVLTGIPVDENPQSTIVSYGASYTKSAEAGAEYPDTYGTELTDGIRSNIIDGNYSDAPLSGYNSSVTVIMDLGTVYDRLYSFKVGYLCYNEAGISEPASMAVHASIDGKKWTRVGSLSKAVPPEDDTDAYIGTVQEATLQVNGYIMGQYIRFDIVSSSAWIFVDETIAIADIDGSQKNVQYLESVNAAYQNLGSFAKPTSDVEINRELDKVLISEGAKYEVNGKEKNFSDKGKKMLTDGITTGYYEGESWVGYDLSSDVIVTLDLGKTETDIASIEAKFFTNTAISVFLPVAVKMTGIDDNNNRIDLGILYGNTVMTSGSFSFALHFDKAISARYIEFTFYATDTSVAMVEELAVYAYREVEQKQLYPSFTLETEVTEWGNEGSSEYVNLANGLLPNILTASDPGEDNYKNNTPVTSKVMTDGTISNTTDIHNGRFFKFSNGGGRTVYFDLTHLSAVDKITAGFVERTDWAVRRPTKVNAFVSPDANNWYSVGEIVLQGTGENYVYRGTLELDGAVNVRYVAISFDVGAWVGCDEIEIFGKKNSSGSDPSRYFESTPGIFSTKRIEPSEELLAGAKDLCLMYHAKDYNYSVEELIPYLAYVDSEGTPKDIMFDSFLFLHNNSKMPSGGSPHTGSVMTDWTWTIEDLFTEGQNVMALEEAAGQVKTALGLAEDYKYKYAVTLYYPIKFDDKGGIVAYNFGDIDGDGTIETTANYEDRVKIMQWYIDEIEKKVAECNFQNIELVAYYWWHEAIETVDVDGKALLNEISNMVHAVDKDFFWIPYFCSTGYNQWAEYGFDIACMQPNYVFDAEAPYKKVTDCATLTQQYGMGFEMEVDGVCLSQELFYKKYMEYLGSGATLGYMNDTIVMYYQSVTVFLDAANAESTMARNIYDQTYHFIKGDLVYNPESITGLNFEATKNTPSTFTVEFSSDVPRQFQINVLPEHGTVTPNGDGTFTFYPEKDYTGEVTFSFAYNEYLGWSDPCEVTINVK